MNEIVINNESELSKVAAEIVNSYPENRIFIFKGDMGSGKTTLIKEICRQLGVVDDMTSPTFAIVNEYLTDKEESIFHFDLYRLDSVDDAVQIGFKDYIYSGCYCFIEWPEIAMPLLDEEEYIVIKIDNLGENSRKFTF